MFWIKFPRLQYHLLCLDIVQAFKRSLKSIAWMDKESAQAAADKVTSTV